MKGGFIVVRKEKHIDDKYWVCETIHDALRIAQDVTGYWKNEYGCDKDQDVDVDETLYENLLFHYSAEDMFSIIVQPQHIREKGEHCEKSQYGRKTKHCKGDKNSRRSADV